MNELMFSQQLRRRGDLVASVGGLAVSVFNYEATGSGSILSIAIFPG